MKLIETFCVVEDDTVNGKRIKKTVNKEREFPLDKILDFNVNQYGDFISRVEDRVDLLEYLMKKVILRNPEDFRDYIQECCDKNNENHWRNKLTIQD
jgi:hypothetical protein